MRMKKNLLLVIAVGLVLSLTAQIQPPLKHNRNAEQVLMPAIQGDGDLIGIQQPNHLMANDAILDDPIVMNTRYDLQSNSSNENRIYYYPDGTMGAAATMSHLDNFSERGSGYNYFNGTEWGLQPDARIETVRTGWPSYAPCGANGEIIISHQSGTLPLIICKRDTKGTGAWTQTELGPPTGASGMLWPRLVTNGPDHLYVHLICMTSPTGNGGVMYEGLDGALVYNRSLDGGATWDGWQLLDGMTSAEYLAFSGDSYAWANPRGNTLCFTTGDNWYDQFIMKSTDNGDNWTKTVIWDCPFDLWEGGDSTGRFNCSDGCSSVALDLNGNAHVLFGYQTASGDEAGSKYWVPWTDGLVYWNETMSELPQEMDWDELYASGNMIGWVQDTNVWHAAATELAYYYNSMTSYPTIVADDWGNLFALWSGVTTLRDQYSYLLRHIFARASTDNGQTWRDTIVDLTGDFLYTWSECVFPSASPTSTDHLYIIMMADLEAGLQFYGSQGAQGQTATTQNDMTILTPLKVDIIVPGVGVNEQQPPVLQVSQNSPNPFRNSSVVYVNLTKPGELSMEISSITGQNILTISKGTVSSGNHQFLIDGSQFSAGIYCYTVKTTNGSVTRKMVVE